MPVLSSKLNGVEKNNASAWLPGSAESTKVLDVQSRFQSLNIYTGVVVYVRDSGITAADRTKAAADARQFAGVQGALPRRTVGPIESPDGKAIATTIQVDLGSKGSGPGPSNRQLLGRRDNWSQSGVSPRRIATRQLRWKAS